MNKDQIRTSALQRRHSLTPHQRNSYSKGIITSLLQHLPKQTTPPECLLTYRAVPSEVATDALLQTTNYRMFAPVTQSDTSMQWLHINPTTTWKKGVFAILEPEQGQRWQPHDGLTTLICPLSAFDRQGHRLGMGKGCFDTWLSQFGRHIHQVIGLAFSCQEIAQVPIEDHDMPMDIVITEQEVIECTKLARII